MKQRLGEQQWVRVAVGLVAAKMKKDGKLEKWPSIPEVAAYLGVTKQTLYNWLKAGTLAGNKAETDNALKLANASGVDLWLLTEPMPGRGGDEDEKDKGGGRGSKKSGS